MINLHAIYSRHSGSRRVEFSQESPKKSVKIGKNRPIDRPLIQWGRGSLNCHATSGGLATCDCIAAYKSWRIFTTEYDATKNGELAVDACRASAGQIQSLRDQSVGLKAVSKAQFYESCPTAV